MQEFTIHELITFRDSLSRFSRFPAFSHSLSVLTDAPVRCVTGQPEVLQCRRVVRRYQCYLGTVTQVPARTCALSSACFFAGASVPTRASGVPHVILQLVFFFFFCFFLVGVSAVDKVNYGTCALEVLQVQWYLIAASKVFFCTCCAASRQQMKPGNKKKQKDYAMSKQASHNQKL